MISATSRPLAKVREEITSHFGYFPPFYQPALENAEILENLWHQTLAADIHNPLPALFREKVAAYIGRFCPFPFEITLHSAHLHRMGLSGGEILALLEESAPKDAATFDKYFRTLTSQGRPLARWPASGSPVEGALVRCAAAIFLALPGSGEYQAELQRVLGQSRFAHLVSLLAWLRTCHLWVEAHPGLLASADRTVKEHYEKMVKEEPRLASFLRDYPERVRNERLRSSAQIAAVQANQEHEAGERRFHQLVDNARDILYRYRLLPSPGFEFVSPAVASITGYTPEEHYADPKLGLRMIHPEDRPLLDLLARPASPSSAPVVLRWRRRSGETIWTEHFATPILDREGRVVAVEGIARDITQRMLAEEGIRILNLVLQDVNDTSDLESALEIALSWGLKAGGWSLGEAWLPSADGAWLECRAIVHEDEDERRRYRDALSAAAYMAGEGLPGLAWREKTVVRVPDLGSDGRFRRHAEFEGSLKAGVAVPALVEGEVAAVLVFFHHEVKEQAGPAIDLVTTVAAQLGPVIRRKQAEETLRESEERLRSFAESTSDAVVVGDATGSIVSWNRGAEAMFGYAAKEVLGRSLTILMPERQRQAHLAGLHRFRETGQSKIIGQTVEMKALRQDGQEFPVELSISSWTTRKGMFFGAIVRDVGERKKMEEQIVRAQRADAMGQVARALAHDFSNQMTAILGSTMMLQHRLPKEDPLQEEVLALQRSAEIATALTRRMQSFGRSSAGQPRAVDMNAVIEESAPMLRRIVGDRVEVVTIFARDLGLVFADAAQLEQAIVSLALPAREALTLGGRVTVETANVEPGQVMLAVTHVGPNMEQELLDRFAAPITHPEVHDVDAMGMSGVQSAVRQAGGKIEYYAQRGHGATFKILLPRVADAVSPVKPRIPVEKPTETVLLVEDDRNLRATLQGILSRAGYTVLSARSGDEAIMMSRAHAGHIHLLVTDILMSGMSGRELAKRIVGTRPVTKVLYISGDASASIARYVLIDEKTPFLMKPFTPERFLAKVREVLGVAAT